MSEILLSVFQIQQDLIQSCNYDTENLNFQVNDTLYNAIFCVLRELNDEIYVNCDLHQLLDRFHDLYERNQLNKDCYKVLYNKFETNQLDYVREFLFNNDKLFLFNTILYLIKTDFLYCEFLKCLNCQNPELIQFFTMQLSIEERGILEKKIISLFRI